MKRILILFSIISVSSCSNSNSDKSNKQTVCYECDYNGQGLFEGVGCMTEDEWNKFQPTDLRPNNLGNDLDKSKYCRKQKLPE